MKEILLEVVRGAMQVVRRSGPPTLSHVKAHPMRVPEVVSEVDLQVERFLCEQLKARFPNALFLAEELSSEERFEDVPLCFIIDPIDGTTEYLGGGNCYAVSVGAIKFGEMFGGALGFPAKDVVVVGTRGDGVVAHGATLVEQTPPRDSMIIAVSPREIDTSLVRRLQLRLRAEILPIPSFTSKALSVFVGEADVAIYQAIRGVLQIWDYAATAVLARELGYRFESFSGDLNLLTSHPKTHADGWILGSDTVVDRLREASSP